MNIKIYILLVLSVGLFWSCVSKPKKNEEVLANPIVGKWEVVHSSFAPYDHISYCRNLTVGSQFVFGNEGQLLVYVRDAKKHCNDNQKYSIRSNTIEIIEFDMVFFYEILELTSDKLKFKINRLPRYVYEDEFEPPKNDPDFLRNLGKIGIILSLNKVQ